MTRASPVRLDPQLDLVLERSVDVPKELVWKAWTRPELLKQWFTPKPWSTVECEIDLRPGGIFRTVMRSPEGQDFSNLGCYLEVVENQRLVFTNVLEPGFRPAGRGDSPDRPECDTMPFTAVISIEAHGKGTKYTAIAIHRDPQGREKHEKMGFHDGWGAALDQLVELAKRL